MKGLCFFIAILALCFSQPFFDIFLGERQEPGYIDLGNNNRMFYWLIQSRDRNQYEPLIITLPGGPGCSGLEYAFEHNGPFRINSTTNTTLIRNHNSFNNFADLLYVDQPFGTGFSYSFNESRIPKYIYEAAEDFINFITQFIQKYTHYQSVDIYFNGQGYGGHWAIIYTDYLLSHMATKFNIKGVLIGNPMLMPTQQILSYAPFMFSKKKISFSQYVESYAASFLTGMFHYMGQPDIALMFYDMIYSIQAGQGDKKFSCYDITKPCHIEGCVDYNGLYTFINQRTVRMALGVSETYPFSYCNSTVNHRMKNVILSDVTIPFVRLLDNFTIPVILFNGNNDWLVNNEGLYKFLTDLVWSGQEEYRRGKFTDIHSDGKLVGSFKRAKNLFHV